MPAVFRKGDTASGHGCFPSSSATGGSPDVEINGIPVMRVGDAVAAHGCPDCPPHGRAMAAGSGTVEVNGKPVCRVGDAVDCGGSAASGSSDVEFG